MAHLLYSHANNLLTICPHGVGVLHSGLAPSWVVRGDAEGATLSESSRQRWWTNIGDIWWINWLAIAARHECRRIPPTREACWGGSSSCRDCTIECSGLGGETPGTLAWKTLRTQRMGKGKQSKKVVPKACTLRHHHRVGYTSPAKQVSSAGYFNRPSPVQTYTAFSTVVLSFLSHVADRSASHWEHRCIYANSWVCCNENVWLWQRRDRNP